MESQHGKNPFPGKPKPGKGTKQGPQQPEGYEKLQEEGRFQNPNETNAPERVSEKVQNDEPGNLERKGAENNDHNQNRDPEENRNS